ncbi:GNAT family N-acetyltransferase [Prevotella sp.]|uniref:GNAT family N-acetyltransferase n=1 Tax=Prevotella sp. TaxID=59823 RepID=UPI002648FDC1|nr:GNAT family N-acetyltransferase [Prevotella sp.]MDN5553760.1 GNAT family N-acetyltransferase [Prevotella sp.]
MKLDQATINDFESVIKFYDDVTQRTPEMDTYARWKKGQHPTEEGIKAYIQEGSMYLYKNNGSIVGAMAVTMFQGEEYHAIEWSQQVKDNEAAVIHILAVSPDYQGAGLGTEMIRKAISISIDSGMKSVRLDALASNTPAHKIYERIGFEYRGKQHLYAENTGWTDFFFFELTK